MRAAADAAAGYHHKPWAVAEPNACPSGNCDRNGSAALRNSPFALLDSANSLHLIVDAVDPHTDAFFFALVCRTFRDALACDPQKVGKKFVTGDAGVIASKSRLAWVLSLPGTPWPAFSGLYRETSANVVCSRIAAAGKLDLLQWARANGFRWGEATCNRAARAGHLEILRYLRASDPPARWSCATCTSAAEGGHVEILEWLRSNGCPWDEHTCEAAWTNQKPHALQWALDHGCPVWPVHRSIPTRHNQHGAR